MLVSACFAALALGCGGDSTPPLDAGGSDAATSLDGGPPPIEGTEYWVAVDGDDSSAGTREQPFGSIEHGLGALRPGDTLVLANGDHPDRIRIGCDESADECEGAPCANGLPNGPITVRSETERGAHLLSGGGTAVDVHGCSYWTIEGLHLEGEDVMGTGSGTGIVLLDDSSHLVFRRNLLHHSNRYANNHGVQVGHGDSILLEENELYDINRAAFALHDTVDLVVRRNYANGRNVQNIPAADGGYTCCCDTTMDDGISLGGGYRATIENNVFESVCNAVTLHSNGYTSAPRRYQNAATRVIGNVFRDVPTNGVWVRTLCEDADPCPGNAVLTDVEVADLVVVDANRILRGFASRDAVYRDLTGIGIRDVAFDMQRGDGNAGALDTSWVLMNALDVGDSGTSYAVRDQDQFQIVRTNSFGSAVLDTGDAAAGATEQTEIDPELGGCTAWVPESSPMHGAGIGGRDIGANVLYRLHDGTSTDEPLWDPVTGAFTGCGAEVPGVNDDATFPDAACVNVQARLHVGTADCPLPYR